MAIDPVLAAILLLFGLALVTALVLTPLARRFALRVGLVDNPGERKIHGKVTPYGGGIAIFLTTFGLPVLGFVALRFVDWEAIAPGLAKGLMPYIQALAYSDTQRRFAALLAGGLLVFSLGLYDDMKGLGVAPKLTVQALAALLLVAADVRVTFFIDSYALSVILTVIWVVAVTNAFNLLDNMDGLSAGVAGIASLLFLVIALQGERVFVAGFLVIFAGALLGFLRHNFAPATLFMGDAGSLFVGYVLASLTVLGTYYQGRGSLYSVCMPVLVLGVPLFDTASVLWIRFCSGKPLFQGDTNHLSHRLVRLGMTCREAVLTIYLLGLILGGAATLLRQLDTAGAIVILLIALGIVALIVLLENAAKRQAQNS